MSDYSYKYPSNVQLNKGHKHTDDFITKKYILPMLRDPQKLQKLIDEHRANPVGKAATRNHGVIQHSQDLQTVLDKLRRASKEGGFVSVCLKLHEDYRIGITTELGEPVQIQMTLTHLKKLASTQFFLKNKKIT